MNPYDQTPSTTARRRRTVRNADSYMTEPSMSAPQPMPPASGRRQAVQPAVPTQQYPADMQAYAPMQPMGQTAPQTQPQQPAPSQGWPMPYGGYPQQPAAQPYPAQYSQPYQPYGGYPVQPEQPQQWQQPYQEQQQSWQGYAPPIPDEKMGGYQPPKPPTKGGNPPGSGSQRFWGIALIVILVLIVALIALAIAGCGGSCADNGGGATGKTVAQYENIFCEGVYIDGLDVGGMTQSEAAQAVQSSVQQRLNEWQVSLTLDGYQAYEVTAAELGMAVEVLPALQAAWAVGHEGTTEERLADIESLVHQPVYLQTSQPVYEDSEIDRILNDLAARVYLEPRDSYLKEFNPQLTNPFVIEAGQVGRQLNVEAARTSIKALASTLNSGSVELEIQEIQPAIQTGTSEIVLRGSAYTAISTTSTENRTNNIKRAFELISGTVLRPGESFSFNNVVGARSAKNGFYPAIEYAYGEEREGYGGGVCQASTTMYIAAVRANMDIVKREQHSDKVNYTAYGLDATVNLDGKKIDFVFKNNTSSNIYIVASVQYDRKIDKNHSIARVDIYGESMGEGVTYDLLAETVEVLLPPEEPEYIEDKKGTHVTYIDQEEVKREASEGCVVDSYKVKYVNGQEVERTKMYTDTYKAKSKQIYVGVTEREDDYWNNGGY